MSGLSAEEAALCVLLVDERKAMSFRLETLLANAGIPVSAIHVVGNPEEGLERLREKPHALVLVRPAVGMDIPSVTHQIRAVNPQQRIVWVVDSGLPVEGLAALRKGAEEVILIGESEAWSMSRALRCTLERWQYSKTLEDLQNMARIGFWQYYPARNEIVLSDPMRRLMGNNPDEIVDGQPVGSLRDFLERIHRVALVRRHVGIDTRVCHEGQDDQYFHVQCRMTTQAGGDSFLQGVLQDVTDRYQAEELRNARDLARQTAGIREQFMAGISHELRTPINAIMGLSQLLLAEEPPGEKRDMIGSIRDASDILLGIVNDILEFSAIRAGKIDFRDEVFSPAGLVQDLERILGPKWLEKNLHWHLEIHSDVPGKVRGDKLRLNQILFNLIGNAVKFTIKGRIGLYVEPFEAGEGRVGLLFRIEDTGVGIPLEARQSIFEDFSRVSRPQYRFEGTGLGLAITKQLVEQQGGRIWVESEEGIGSTFHVTLAYGLVPEGEEEAERMESEEPEAVFQGCIMVVEDNRLNQLVARKTLERQWPHATVIMAETGKMALDLMELYRPDLVLMDLLMPGMDGWEATRNIRAHEDPAIRNVPIVAMTANAHVTRDNQLKSQGFTDYVLKPFEPEQLFHTILQYVPIKKLRL